MYLLGAGRSARNIIECLPYGLIEGVMDSDAMKVGQIFTSFIIEEMDLEKIIVNRKEVILSFDDKYIEERLTQASINWYVAWGRNSRNIFMREDISELIIGDLKSRFFWDTRIKDRMQKIENVSWFREYPYSDLNGQLIELMKQNDLNAISDILNNFYDNIEKKDGLLDDEYFEYRTGLKLAAAIIEQMSHGRENILCDIACGHGEFIRYMAKKGIKVEGVDISEARVMYIRNKGVAAFVGTAESTNKGDEVYDYITCFECLEHIINPVKAICEMKRILKTGGYLFISVPYKDRCDCSTHVRLFDENVIYTLLEQDFIIVNALLIPYVSGDINNSIFAVARKKG